MKKILKNTIAIILFGVFVFFLRTPILNSYHVLMDKYFPCNRPISFSIGSFDKSFGISQEDFLKEINYAENTWETSINKELFIYKPEGGEMKINLIFDDRQASTDKLKGIDETLKDNKGSYDDIKARFEALKKEYDSKKTIFESKLSALQTRREKYEKEVIYWNDKGGASKKVYNRLTTEKEGIEKDIEEINKLQDNLNYDVAKINKLVNELNSFASSFNNQVKNYNNINAGLGEEFEEGNYKEDQNGKEIDIYQFENNNILQRLLMHELGHALSLDHLNNFDSIMFRLNQGGKPVLMKEDIEALKNHCKIN